MEEGIQIPKMNSLPEEVEDLFKEVLQKSEQSRYKLTQDLWEKWHHLGVEHETKLDNISQLVQIEADFFEKILAETRDRYNTVQTSIENLKLEAVDLSQYLSQEITVPEVKEGVKLVDYKKELDEYIERYREIAKEREANVIRLVQWQNDLINKLGVTMSKLQEIPLPSEQEMNDLEKRLQTLQDERDKRADRFLYIQAEVKDIMDKLKITPKNKFELEVTTSMSTNFKLTDLNMDRLAKMHQDMVEEYEQTNNRVLKLREGLTKLWDFLDEDREYCSNFLQSHQGCHPETEEAIRDEISRCSKIKAQNVQVYIDNIRSKIEKMWDKIKYSQEERLEFKMYNADLFTEDVLTLHEIYLERITEFYNKYSKIFELADTCAALRRQAAEMQQLAANPSRLHNRGGQLLKEEKARKVLSSKLNKIESEIIELVTKYEKENNKVFTIKGKPLLKIIQDGCHAKKF